MAANYDSTSAYFNTSYTQFYLDVMTNRPIPKEPDDQLWAITETYQYRPDLLAYDLYGDSNLWWVFAVRNPNTLVDPLWDFTADTQIYLPQKSTLQTVLSI